MIRPNFDELPLEEFEQLQVVFTLEEQFFISEDFLFVVFADFNDFEENIRNFVELDYGEVFFVDEFLFALLDLNPVVNEGGGVVFGKSLVEHELAADVMQLS